MGAMVSIVVPSFNHGRFLNETLQGVIAQTYQDWELLIVDDGSADDSVAIASKLAESNSRIHLHLNPVNLGTYATLNRGIDLATGDWIAVLNSDDLWLPDKLRLQVELLEKHPESQFSYTRAILIDAESNPIASDHHRDYPTSEVQNLLPYLFDVNQVLASSLLMRKGAVRFDDRFRYSGDWVAAIRLARQSAATFVDQPLVGWRQHGENSSSRLAAILPEEIAVRKWVQKHGPSWSDKTELESRKHAASSLELGVHLFLAGQKADARRCFTKVLRHKDAALRLTAAKRLLATFLPKERVLQRFAPGVAFENFPIATTKNLQIEG